MKTLILNTKKNRFTKMFLDRLNIRDDINQKTENFVRRVIQDIKKNRDKSLIKYISKYDNKSILNIKKILVTKSEIKKAYKLVSKDQIINLKKAISRIKKFSKNQLHRSWSYKDGTSILGEKITAINSVGVYVPGGKASYPSTVMMNVIPARVAGVNKVYMTCPINNLADHALAIVAGDLCNVDLIFKMGGAHSIAALAYGTSVVPKVDKIVGPGNLFVSTAKKIVYGDVGIDNIAGPSEIVIVGDDKNNPDMIAIDLFSQAEHDELAQPILVSKSEKLLLRVLDSMRRLLPKMPRKKIIMQSVKNRGMFIKTSSDSETAEIINIIAPEHLELLHYNQKLIKQIHNAGAIFIGENSPEVFGDYCAGPNHVLPTSGSARFSSPLGAHDFLKRSSVINISKKDAVLLSKISESLAEAEGLHAHALSAKIRGK